MQITHDLAIGGLQQVVTNICRSLNKELFDVSVLCLRSRGEFANEIERLGIRVHSLPRKKGGTDYFSFLQVARILKREGIDVIHTHNTQPLIDGTLAARLAGVKAIIHTDHARPFPDKRRYMFAERVLSHFVYRVVGVSEYTSRELAVYEKIAPEKITTVVNGIDGSMFNLTVDLRAKRSELGLDSQGPVLGVGVRLTEQKGLTYLLQALPEVAKVFPGVVLLIAGAGPLAAQLKQEADARGIGDRVRFLGPRMDIAELLHLFDLYVLPSLWEGLPMVLLEALAAGCPVVATDVGGNSTAITNGENGTLVEPKNPRLLAEAIVQLLGDEALRKRFASNGAARFRECFSADIMTRQYEQLYLQAIESATGAAGRSSAGTEAGQ